MVLLIFSQGAKAPLKLCRIYKIPRFCYAESAATLEFFLYHHYRFC